LPEAVGPVVLDEAQTQQLREEQELCEVVDPHGASSAGSPDGAHDDSLAIMCTEVGPYECFSCHRRVCETHKRVQIDPQNSIAGRQVRCVLCPFVSASVQESPPDTAGLVSSPNSRLSAKAQPAYFRMVSAAKELLQMTEEFVIALTAGNGDMADAIVHDHVTQCEQLMGEVTDYASVDGLTPAREPLPPVGSGPLEIQEACRAIRCLASEIVDPPKEGSGDCSSAVGVLASYGGRAQSLQDRLENYKFFGSMSGASPSGAPTNLAELHCLNSGLPARAAMLEGICFACRRPSGA